MRERRLARIRPALVRRVGHVVRARTARAVITPDMVQIEPVPDFVRGRAAQVEGGRSRADGAEGRLQDHHAIGGCRPAGKLRVAQQAATQLADPDIEVGIGRPRIHAARRLRFDGVVGAKRRHRRLAPLDATGGRAIRIRRGQRKLDAHIGRQRQEWRRRIAHVGIGVPVIAVQHVDLAGDLRVRDILRGRIPYDMYHHRYLRHAGAPGNAAVALVQARQVFNVGAYARVRRIFAQQATMHVHRGAGAYLRRAAALSPAVTAHAATATRAIAVASHAAAIAHMHAAAARHALRCLMHATAGHGPCSPGTANLDGGLVHVRHAQAWPRHVVAAVSGGNVRLHISLDRHCLHGRHGGYAFGGTGCRRLFRFSGAHGLSPRLPASSLWHGDQARN